MTYRVMMMRLPARNASRDENANRFFIELFRVKHQKKQEVRQIQKYGENSFSILFNSYYAS